MDTPQNLFASPGLASGYATSRPPVHPKVIDRLRARLPSRDRKRALDVGCGAGLSTRPLERIARHCIGMEPAGSMLRWTESTAPHAQFVVGSGEQLPFRRGSVDIITAAGSLNYVPDLGRFFSEASRVLTFGGELVVYDFSPGRRCPDSDALDSWYRTFMEGYPAAKDSARTLDVKVLPSLATGFEVQWGEQFVVSLTMDLESYERYVMTETNVGYAVSMGTPEAEIREWCNRTLRAVFGGVEKEVLFDAYTICFSPA